MPTETLSLPLRAAVGLVSLVVLLGSTLAWAPETTANHETAHPIADQGLSDSGEEQAFAKALPLLMGNDNVDAVVTMRESTEPRDECTLTGTVYWVYSTRGDICFTRAPDGEGWTFDDQVLNGINPIGDMDHTALATRAEERAASTTFLEEVPYQRNLVGADAVTYPFAYERIVAEFDSPRTGDFIIMPDNTADRGGKGAHGHLGITQSRSTLIVSGRGARRSPLSSELEPQMGIQHPDIAPTVASVLGINPYFEDTGQLARVQNGSTSTTALLKRQDGQVLNDLIEPKFNTFVISVDGLRPEDVEPTLMPNLTSLVSADCTDPGDDCATSYEQARAIMVTETNANHTAMITGAYGEGSGIVANQSLDRNTDAAIDTDQPELNFAETIFDSIESEKPWMKTALVMGKSKLRDLFDCTRTDTGDCGSSSNNPEGVKVDHLRPDIVAGALEQPDPDFDSELDCPAEPGTGSGYTTNECVMDKTLKILNEEDPDFTFVNLPEVDGFSHLHGPDSPSTKARIVDADMQLGRLIERLKESNRWQHSTVIVTADHNFGETITPDNHIIAEDEFESAGPAPFRTVTHGGSASIFLTELGATETPDAVEQATLAQIRQLALQIDGVEEALYRLPNPVDGGSAFTIDNVHPNWNLGGTDRIGELLIVADEQHAIFEDQTDDDRLFPGQHGHSTDRHVPFVVASGGPYLVDQTVAASTSAEINERDDTAALPEQAENVDIAPTLAWLLGVDAPSRSQGRILSEAFSEHPMKSQEDGDITEPIANRAAIFIYDGNNSVEVHCLLKSETCGDDAPPEAGDPTFIPTLGDIVSDGTLTRFGSAAAWPSVTFPNHNVIGSGTYPGHHGIVNNRFYLREEKKVEQPINSQSTDYPLFTFTNALLSQDIETLHEAVHRTYGDWAEADGPGSSNAYTASVNEPSARGADYATLEPDQSFPNPAEYIATENPTELAQDTTQSCAEDQGYLQESGLDHIGQTQARRVFEDTAQHPIPKYFINNFTITDGAGHHFGAHTECTLAAYRDSDRRLTRIVSAMKSAGVFGETLIVVTGDHGMENQNLDRRGLPSDFAAQLNEANIDHVMTDWHVYLLTMGVSSSKQTFRPGDSETSMFTVTDHDTGEPVEGALVTIEGEQGNVLGRTGVGGVVELTFVPTGDPLSALVTHESYNQRTLPLQLEGVTPPPPVEKCPGMSDLPGNHIVGTGGIDHIEGTPGPDVICAKRGNDSVKALGGDDLVIPGPGKDDVSGGPGSDHLRVSPAADTLRGGGGNDLVRGGKGADALIGNSGADTIYGWSGHDELAGGRHNDKLFGGEGDDFVDGGAGSDACRVGPGTNRRKHCES